MTYCSVCGQTFACWAGCPGGERLPCPDNPRRIHPAVSPVSPVSPTRSGMAEVERVELAARVYDEAESIHRHTGYRKVMDALDVGHGAARTYVQRARERGLVA